MYAGGAEEALKQLAAAGLSQRCGTLGSVASGLGRRWPVQEGLPRRNGRREVGGIQSSNGVQTFPTSSTVFLRRGRKTGGDNAEAAS